MRRIRLALVGLLVSCAHLRQPAASPEQGASQLYQPPPPAEQELLQQVLNDQTAQIRGDFYLLSELRWNYDTRRNTFEQWRESVWQLRVPAHRGIPDSLSRRFWDANQRPKRLKDVHLQLGPRLRVVQPGHRPGDTASILTLSRVGFNSVGDSALVAARFVCAGLCGSDELLLYVREAGSWRQKAILSQINY